MKKQKNNGGYALVMSLTSVAVITAGSAVLCGMASQNAFMEKNKANQRHAKILSEAGVRMAYAKLRNNPGQFNSSASEISMNGGTLSTEIIKQAAGVGVGNVILRAKGNYKGIDATSAIAMAYAGANEAAQSDSEDAPQSDLIQMMFEAAMFCGKNATMTGSSLIELNGGMAHINGTLRMVGGAAFENNGLVSSSSGITLTGGAKINADAAAPEIAIPSGGAMSEFVTGVSSESTVPEQFVEIDLKPFYEYAKSRDIEGDYTSSRSSQSLITDSYISADEIKNGKFTLNAGQILRPDGGVVWIEGQVTLNGSSVVEGCVVAIGDIKVCGNMTQVNPSGLPSYMSQSGDVDLQSGCVAYGLLYAHSGDIRIGGDATVDGGAFICPRGSFTHNGSGTIRYASSSPRGPSGEDVTLPNLVETIMTDEGEIPIPAYMGWVE